MKGGAATATVTATGPTTPVGRRLSHINRSSVTRIKTEVNPFAAGGAAAAAIKKEERKLNLENLSNCKLITGILITGVNE